MKITVLSLDLYGFNEFIAKELQKKEIEVTYINSAEFKYNYKNFTERSKNFLSKIFLKRNLKKLKKTEFVLNKISNDIKDVTLVIDSAQFNHINLKEIRKKSKKLIAYNYDSMVQLTLTSDKITDFDERYSVDKNDCEK